MPDDVTQINNCSLLGFRDLESIKFHNQLTKIGDYAFKGTEAYTNQEQKYLQL